VITLYHAPLTRSLRIVWLRQDAAAVLGRVRKSSKPVVITQRGRPAAVMLSPEAFARSEHERQLLQLLVRGEREIAAGKGHELGDVLKEVDAILARKS
jgi:prevent-host-death family protein